MLREVKDAEWLPTGLLRRRYVFRAGDVCCDTPVRPGLLAALDRAQRSRAVPVMDGERGRTYWWCLDRFFWEDDGLEPEDVFALVYERQLRDRRRIERARATVAARELAMPRREGIPRELRLAAWERDGGACVVCGSAFELQFDHVIPVALGGATTLDNLQVLCGACNRAKGASLG